MPRLLLPRLYAILDLDRSAARAVAPDAVLDAWLEAGVRLIQLRAKGLAFGPMLELAERLVARAATVGATLIVNDRADVARLSRASGLHVGQDDLAPSDARQILAAGQIVGLSTHTSCQVAAAIEQPVDYLAIGPVYQTTTKARPDAVVGLGGVRSAAELAKTRGIPLVAIGGITLAAATEVLEAGADSVAVISDLLSAPDPRRRAREWTRALG